MTQPPQVRTGRFRLVLSLLAYGGPLACLAWAFWPTLVESAQRWASDASYSHGYLVPFFALGLLWLRRAHMPADLLCPSWLLGLPVLGAGIALRLVGTYYHYVWFEQIALVPCIAGAFLLVGGWPVWRWAWPAIAFLAFMIPLPYRVANAWAGDLQNFATIVSTFLLQVLGMPALSEGNHILLSHVDMGIVEACSGLRMLMVFFALSTAFALLVQRPLWEKGIVVISAVPIALACNVLRITATGVLHETVSSDVANAVFHDFAGWLMMPMGLAMLWLELKLLQLLWTDAAPDEDLGQPAPAQPAPPPPARSRRRPWQPARSSRAASVGLGSSGTH